MQHSITFDIQHAIHNVVLELRRRQALRRLSKGLAQLNDQELDDLLAEAGMQRKDLFANFVGNAPHRRLMGRMLMHFGVDRERASRHNWDDLVHAESRCAQCPGADRCRQWFEARRTNIAPNIFCPNAALFEYMCSAQAQFAAARSRVYSYTPDTPDSEAARVAAAWNAVRCKEEKPFWRQ